MVDVPGAFTQKVGPLPAWGWAAIGGGAIVGVAVVRRLRSGGGSTPASTSAKAAQPSTADTAGVGAGSGGGSSAGGDGPLQAPGGGSSTVITDPHHDAAPSKKTPADSTSSNGGGAPGPTVDEHPPSSSLLDRITAPVAAIVGGGTVRNPVGFALEEQARNQGTYTPSPLDFLSERLSGVTYNLISPDTGAGPANAYSTIYTNVGPNDFPAATANATPALGKIIDAGARIPGERYISLPGNKLQVVN